MTKKVQENLDVTNELFDYGISRRSRTIICSGQVDEDLLHRVESGLTLLEGLGEDIINIRLCTPGGEVDIGNAILDRILSSNCQIYIHAYGQIKSMGIFLLAAGDIRSCSSLTSFMHHGGSYAIEGTSNQNKAYLKYSEIQDSLMHKWLASRTKKDSTFWGNTGADVDHWFTCNEALEYGLVHKIIN